MKPLRVYTDTSVIGGCSDKEFADDSNRLIELARAGRVRLLISDLVINELQGAPDNVRNVLPGLPASAIEEVRISQHVIALRDAYVQANIVGPRWRDDATHVAAATVARADAIVSWNFRHIVRLDLIGRYNEVNQSQQYSNLVIITPLEVTREIDTENGERI